MHNKANVVAAWALSTVDAVVAGYGRAGLTEREVAALVLLGSHPGAGIDWLFPRLGLTQSGTVRLVDRLAEAGLVARGAVSAGRRVPLTLTRAGRQRLDQATAARADAVAAVTTSLTAAEQQTLARLTAKALAGMTRDRTAADTACPALRLAGLPAALPGQHVRSAPARASRTVMAALLATRRGAALPASVRRLTLVLVLSATADAFALVALLWYLTVSHAGAAALGGLVLAAGVPAVVSGPPIGRWLERRPARWLLAADKLARAAVLLLVAALAAARVLTLPALFALAAVTGVLSPVTYAGSRVLLPALVAEPDLVRANGMLAIGDQFPLLAAPALAGVAASLLGGTTALVIPAAALALAGWAAAGLPAAPPARPTARRARPAAPPARAGALPPLRAAAQPRIARAARADRRLLFRLRASRASHAAVLHSGGTGHGALWSAFGLGALLGLLAVGRLARLRPGLVNAAGTVLWGAATLPLVLVGALPAALPVMLADGLIWGPYGAIETATIQRITPRAVTAPSSASAAASLSG